MANLTITVDDETLKRARMRALEMGTSVNAILSQHLVRFADPASAQQLALRDLFSLGDETSKADRARARRRGGRRWTRADLHER